MTPTVSAGEISDLTVHPLGTFDSAENPHISSDIASDAEGTWIVVWSSGFKGGSDGFDGEIYYSRSVNDGFDWSEAAVITNGAEMDGFKVLNPRIETDGNENWVIAWEGYYCSGGDCDTRNTEIFVSHSSDSGVSWSTISQVSSPDASFFSEVNPSLAVSSGEWILIWQALVVGRPGSFSLCASKSYNAGLTWSGVEVITFGSDPQVRILNSGEWGVITGGASFFSFANLRTTWSGTSPLPIPNGVSSVGTNSFIQKTNGELLAVYAISSQNSGDCSLFRSTRIPAPPLTTCYYYYISTSLDQGVTWEAMGPILSGGAPAFNTFDELHADDSGKLVLDGTGNGVIVSADGGATWKFAGLPAFSGRGNSATDGHGTWMTTGFETDRINRNILTTTVHRYFLKPALPGGGDFFIDGGGALRAY